jgi:succinyl-CoA synthetase beta subunit
MKILAEAKAEQLISKFLPVAKSILTRNVEQAVKFAKTYPVVIKLISPKALHKTEVGGVKMIRDEKELRDEFSSMIAFAKKKKLPLEGVLVQEYLGGREFIIGIKKDPAFGHVIMFGFGGIFVEVFKDVSFRVCPITLNDADQMVNELKAKKLYSSFRGDKAVNLKILKNVLVKASQIPEKYPKISELDINPFILDEKQGKVADARIIMD